MKKTAYLSLGSNVGDRVANLRAAIRLLSEIGDVVTVSSLYETEPVEVTRQPWFVNCAVKLETEKMPRALLASLLKIEAAMGRRRTQSKGPRNIDLDILLFGNSRVDTHDLSVPHPALHERRFALVPLAEIAPHAIHPVFKRSISELRDALAITGGAVRKLEDRSPAPPHP